MTTKRLFVTDYMVSAKILIGYSLAFCAIVAVIAGIVHVRSYTAGKPVQITMEVAAQNMSPLRFFESYDKTQAYSASQVFTPEDFHRPFRLVLYTRDATGFEPTKYRMARPDDRLYLHNAQDEGRRELWIFTDRPSLDPRFIGLR